MTVRDVYNCINEFAPFNTQMDFDNVGILIGDPAASVTKVVVSLDVTKNAVDFAAENGANLIITHHPIIFEPLRNVLAGSLVYDLVRNNINVISAHTNLDMAKGGVNDCLCEAIGLTNITPAVPCGEVYEARIGELKEPLNCDKFAELLNEKLKTRVKYTGNKQIKTVGVCSGSGGSLIYEMAACKVDAFVTADVKHNVFIDADTIGLALYDCGHYETENVVILPLKKRLEERFDFEILNFCCKVIKYI